jgi:hypothetical protein
MQSLQNGSCVFPDLCLRLAKRLQACFNPENLLRVATLSVPWPFTSASDGDSARSDPTTALIESCYNQSLSS